jgi:hypothetical protein
MFISNLVSQPTTLFGGSIAARNIAPITTSGTDQVHVLEPRTYLTTPLQVACYTPLGNHLDIKA